MLKSERKQVILETVIREKFVSLDYLVHALNTSESTVRRDLDELESEHKLRRVHGGAESFHFLQEEESNQEKSIKSSLQRSYIISLYKRYFLLDREIHSIFIFT